MTHINLLPWREKKRAEEQYQLIRYLWVGFSMAAVIIFFMHYQAKWLADSARECNEELQGEIRQSVQQIKVIKEMKALRQSRLSNLWLLQNLEAMRSVPLRLMEELANMLPSGVYLNRIECVGYQVTLLGYADSSMSISELMRTLGANALIVAPLLTEIKTTSGNNEFKLHFTLKSLLIRRQAS